MLFFNDDHNPVPVTNVRRFNKVAKAMVPCWLYKPASDMEDMLLGQRQDYLMADLESVEFLHKKEESQSWWPFN